MRAIGDSVDKKRGAECELTFFLPISLLPIASIPCLFINNISHRAAVSDTLNTLTIQQTKINVRISFYCWPVNLCSLIYFDIIGLTEVALNKVPVVSAVLQFFCSSFC